MAKLWLQTSYVPIVGLQRQCWVGEPMGRRAANVLGKAELQVAVEKAESMPIRVDIAQLRLGTFVSYKDFDGVLRTGLISELTDKTVSIKLFWESSNKLIYILKEATVPLAYLQEILGQRELPKVVVEEKTVRVAPRREEGYKSCDLKKCERAIFGVIRSQVHRAMTVFKSTIAPRGSVLIALCAGHYKDRFQYGVIQEAWTDLPEPSPGQETPATPSLPKEPADANSSIAVEQLEMSKFVPGKPKRPYKTKLTKEQLKARAKAAAAARWKK